MIIDETIKNISAAISKLRESDPRLDAHLNEPAGASALGAPTFAAADAGHPVPIESPAAWVPPVLGCPQWFLDEVREAYGVARTDYEVDQLCGLTIVQREEFTEPLLVLPDGKTYTVLPDWAKRTAEQIQSTEIRNRLMAGAPKGV